MLLPTEPKMYTPPLSSLHTHTYTYTHTHTHKCLCAPHIPRLHLEGGITADRENVVVRNVARIFRFGGIGQTR